MTADKWREGGSWDSVTGTRGKTTQDQFPRAASAFLLNKPRGRSRDTPVPVLQLCWHCPALVHADGRWADSRRPFHHHPHALIPEGQTQVVLLPASPEPPHELCTSQQPGKTNSHDRRNLQTWKPSQKVPEIRKVEKPRCGRKEQGKRGV